MWTATGVSGPGRPPVLVAGRRGDLQWWGFDGSGDVPQVIITGSDLLLRGPIWLWDLSHEELEEVGDRWVRRPLGPYQRQNRDVIPAVQLAKEFSEPPADPVLLDVTTVEGRRVARVEAGRGLFRCVWEVGVDDLELQIPRFDGGIALSLTYRDGPPPVELPPRENLVDLLAMWERTRRRRTRRKSKPHLSDLVLLPPEDDSDTWVVKDFGLADALGLDSNYEAQSLVQAELAGEDATVFERVSFDSEGSCFFAYCDTESDAETVRRVIGRILGSS